MDELEVLDVTLAGSYVGPLSLVPCGTLTPEHAPHRLGQPWGDAVCAGTSRPVVVRQTVAGQTFDAVWTVAW